MRRNKRRGYSCNNNRRVAKSSRGTRRERAKILFPYSLSRHIHYRSILLHSSTTLLLISMCIYCAPPSLVFVVVCRVRVARCRRTPSSLRARTTYVRASIALATQRAASCAPRCASKNALGTRCRRVDRRALGERRARRPQLRRPHSRVCTHAPDMCDCDSHAALLRMSYCLHAAVCSRLDPSTLALARRLSSPSAPLACRTTARDTTDAMSYTSSFTYTRQACT
jgi:hypothetical protein